MFRRQSNPAVLTSYEYSQKIVPLFSEMSRSKTLQAESDVLMEINLHTVARLQSVEPDGLSESADFPPVSQAFPHLMSPGKLYSKSSDHVDDDESRPVTRRASNQNQSTASPLLSDIANRNLRHKNLGCSAISPNTERLRPLDNSSKKALNSSQSESDDSDATSPEETYAEYLRTRSLPQDPPLPTLKNPPSASLLQGTAASQMRLNQPTKKVKEILQIPPTMNLLQGTAASQSRKISIPSLDQSQRAWTRKGSTPSTISPTDALLLRLKLTPTVTAGNPLSSTVSSLSSSISSSPAKELQPCVRRQSTTTQNTLYSGSGSTSIDSFSSFVDAAPTYAIERSTKQSHSMASTHSSKAEQRIQEYFRSPVLHEGRRNRKEFAMSTLDRSNFWRDVLVISSMQTMFEGDLVKQRTEREEKETAAAQCIMRALLSWRAKRFALVCLRRESLNHISRLIAKVVRRRSNIDMPCIECIAAHLSCDVVRFAVVNIFHRDILLLFVQPCRWRERRAVIRIEDFLTAGSTFKRPTKDVRFSSPSSVVSMQHSVAVPP